MRHRLNRLIGTEDLTPHLKEISGYSAYDNFGEEAAIKELADPHSSPSPIALSPFPLPEPITDSPLPSWRSLQETKPPKYKLLNIAIGWEESYILLEGVRLSPRAYFSPSQKRRVPRLPKILLKRMAIREQCPVCDQENWLVFQLPEVGIVFVEAYQASLAE